MVSKDEVVLAYRLLLGREPENEAVVAHYAAEVANLKALRELFVNSGEFREKLDTQMQPRAPRAAMSGPPMHVELGAEPASLAQLLARVVAQWQHLGETEPHWSVLTNDSYTQENFESHAPAFHASGETECKVFDATLARAGVAREGLRRCVELGCGVGRVTVPLGRRFAEVLGLDVSAAHLRLAHEHVRQQPDLAHVQLRQLSAADELAGVGPFDVLYSRIVLQHNPPPVMARLLTDLLGQLRPGGVAYFQVPTYGAGYRFVVSEYLERPNTTEMEMHYFPQAALLELLAGQRCRLLELREDDAIGLSASAVSNTLLVRKAAV